MAFVCRLTKTHACFIALLSNFLNHFRAEQALGNADYYGVEKSKELHLLLPLQRHFKSLFSNSELYWLYGAASLQVKTKGEELGLSNYQGCSCNCLSIWVKSPT